MEQQGEVGGGAGATSGGTLTPWMNWHVMHGRGAPRNLTHSAQLTTTSKGRLQHGPERR